MGKLDDTAVAWVLEGLGETRPGYCSRWVRQVSTEAFDGRFTSLFGESAKETGKRLMAAGYLVSGPAQDGDILVKMTGSGVNGHIGILTGRGVAENSSTSVGRVHGALGFRTLARWGAFQLAARLPDPSASQHFTLLVHGAHASIMPVIDGTSWCPVVRWAAAMGFTCEWDEDRGRVMLDGQLLDVAPTIWPDGHAYLPIRVLAAAAGVAITVDNQARTVAVG